MLISRRAFTSGAAAVVGSAAMAAPSVAPRRRRAGYGAAVTWFDLQRDVEFAASVVEHCTQIVPVYELKWGTLRPRRDVFDFDLGDKLLGFATENQMTMRGHNLVWYYGLPEWTKEISSAVEAERELVKHIDAVVSHYRGRLTSWDVVNEPIPDDVARPSDRRECLWSRFLGQRYIEIAYRAAAAADPQARLVLNEYDVEFADNPFPIKRAALKQLAFGLLDAGAPLHVIGLQCHLNGGEPIDIEGLSRFVEELRLAGLDVYVTELDVNDQGLPAPMDERDAIVARHANDALSAITASGPLDNLLTWGLSDRHSWISQMFPRHDGLPNRPLPLDADLRPKALMSTLDRFTHAAA